jgi:hypothetical protein
VKRLGKSETVRFIFDTTEPNLNLWLSEAVERRCNPIDGRLTNADMKI